MGAKNAKGRRVHVVNFDDISVSIDASDLQIGAIELKDAGTEARANVLAANTARTTGTVVLAVQHVDAAGAVLPASPYVAPRQSSVVPASFAFQTADQTVFTLAAGERGFIQNCDTDALAVKHGASASPTSLTMILGACAVADDGKGGTVIIDDWIGAVSVAAMTGAARYLAHKI